MCGCQYPASPGRPFRKGLGKRCCVATALAAADCQLRRGGKPCPAGLAGLGSPPLRAATLENCAHHAQMRCAQKLESCQISSAAAGWVAHPTWDRPFLLEHSTLFLVLSWSNHCTARMGRVLAIHSEVRRAPKWPEEVRDGSAVRAGCMPPICPEELARRAGELCSERECIGRSTAGDEPRGRLCIVPLCSCRSPPNPWLIISPECICAAQGSWLTAPIETVGHSWCWEGSI